MSKKAATISDVAKTSGVSIATVSYVLNDGPRRVDPTTKERVLAAMRRLEYHPSTMARGMARKRLGCLGVVFPKAHAHLVLDSYFSHILDGIVSVATERKQNVVLYTGLEWHGRVSLPEFRDRRVDGLLLIATYTDSDIVPSLADAAIPFVLVSDIVPDPRVTCVDIDNAEAVRQVIGHLAALGHRRIALLGGQPNSPSTRPRREGFIQAMTDLALPVDPELMLEGLYDREWGHEGMLRLLRLEKPPTAVFAGGDGIAMGVYDACREKNLSIPAQMSVVGFDDAPFIQQAAPLLTTVRQPLMQIGMKAATLLLDRLDGGAAHSALAPKVVLNGKLIVRESTAEPTTCFE